MHTRVPGGAPLVGVMLVASTGTTRAQDPVRVFDFQPTGSLVVRNQTLHLLIAMAYGMPFPVPLPEERIVGGPEWLATARFAVDARGGAGRAGGRVHLHGDQRTAWSRAARRQSATRDRCRHSRRTADTRLTA